MRELAQATFIRSLISTRLEPGVEERNDLNRFSGFRHGRETVETVFNFRSL